MAQKKKRRLKKSVKRGCLLFFSLPFFIYLLFALRDHLDLRHLTPLEATPASEMPDSLVALRQRIDRIFESPIRVDTSNIAVEICDLQTGDVVYSRHARRLAPPASCMKLLTAVTAMRILGVDHRYISEVKIHGKQRGNTLFGDAIVQLDDDPTIDTLEPFVNALKRHGIGRIEGKMILHLTRTDTLQAHSTAAVWDIPYKQLPILLKGRQRIEQDFRYLLQIKSIQCSAFETSDIWNKDQRTSASESVIYRYETPLSKVLEPMLIHSSNIMADALFAHLAYICNTLPLLDFSPNQYLLAQASAVACPDNDWQNFVVNDGSGLSPDNRITAHFLTQLLCYAWQDEKIRHILIDQALATPGHPTRHGSLLGRMNTPQCREHIFVKTGTLTTRALSSLAGYAQTANGRWLIFAIINEDTPVAESRIFQDRLCGELVK